MSASAEYIKPDKACTACDYESPMHISNLCLTQSI